MSFARSRGSSCDQGAAAIASSRRRASARWPCFCQKRHIENATPIATGGSGAATARSRTARMSSCSSSSRSSQRRCSAPDSSPGRPLHERHVPVAMAVADQVSLAVGLEPFRGVLTDRVEEPEARLAVGGLLDLDQALVDERHQAVEDVHADLGRRPADRFGRGEVAATGEDRQPIEQSLAAVVEQVVAPGDRAAQRLLTLGQVARPGRQDVELVIEPDEDRVGAEQLDPGRGQLDRERHAVEPCADRGDGRRVLVGDR